MFYFFIIKFFLFLPTYAISGDTFKIAFGSCINEEKEIPIWDSIENMKKLVPNLQICDKMTILEEYIEVATRMQP